ncbi:MAG TPA: translesion DNA synthesis-associated protein ImuA [Cellvibrio sp.]|nr:translesion DNA synthesis-associated protein ImuA [Cellvibrio sp.]
MNLTPPDNPQAPNLEQLLGRRDIWRGHAHPAVAAVVRDTGYAALNAQLLGGGWPASSLVEVCQQGFVQSEWHLLVPALVDVSGLVVLLNPPCTPFAQALIKAGLDLERVLVVETGNKADFLFSFIELTRSNTCEALLAWQPNQSLSYTELRKCQLAATEGQGLYVLFRPSAVAEQSSPAALRLSIHLQAQDLHVHIFKQKGELGATAQPVLLPLPNNWQGFAPHHLLDQTGKPKSNVVNIKPVRGGRSGRK